MKEIWKDMIGYKGYYKVSNLGRIKSIQRYKVKKTRFIKLQHVDGYFSFSAYKNRKKECKLVHKEVARSFIGKRPKNMEIRHLDNNKLNNRFDNLKYGTKSENQQDRLLAGTHNRGNRSGKAKLKESDISKILKLKSKGFSYKSISKKFNVSKSTIQHIFSLNRPEWKWLVNRLLKRRK